MFLLSRAILGTAAIYLSCGVGVLRKPVLLYMACFGVFKELFPALTDNRPDHVNTGRRPNHFRLNVMILLWAAFFFFLQHGWFCEGKSVYALLYLSSSRIIQMWNLFTAADNRFWSHMIATKRRCWSFVGCRTSFSAIFSRQHSGGFIPHICWGWNISKTVWIVVTFYLFIYFLTFMVLRGSVEQIFVNPLRFPPNTTRWKLTSWRQIF